MMKQVILFSVFIGFVTSKQKLKIITKHEQSESKIFCYMELQFLATVCQTTTIYKRQVSFKFANTFYCSPAGLNEFDKLLNTF